MIDEKFDINEELLEEAIKRIRKGDANGEVQETNLMVTIAMYKMIKKLHKNPVVVMGSMMKQYPALTIPAVLVGWVLAGASAVIAIMAFFNEIGAVITIP